jgi:N-methylhydantoinase A
VNANMISALKLVSVRRGHDPRDFVLVAAGGGGAMHAAALGTELQVKRVVIPPHAGVFSAWGMGLTEARVDAAQTRVLSTSASGARELDAVFSRLEQEVTEVLLAEGADAGLLRCERSADMRYRGQEHAVRVPIRAGSVSVDAIEADFHVASTSTPTAYTKPRCTTALRWRPGSRRPGRWWSRTRRRRRSSTRARHSRSTRPRT